jgi:hypothetical protein
VVERVGQKVAHPNLGSSDVGAGIDVAFGCDRDVPLPAATAEDLGLGVVEQSQPGPFPTEGRIDVQPYGRAVGGEAADTLGGGLQVARTGEAWPLGGYPVSLGTQEGDASRLQFDGLVQAAPEVPDVPGRQQ